MRELWHLHDIDWTRTLSADERCRLREASLVQEFAPDQLIFAPTRTPRSVYLLESGRARIYRLSDAGTETTFGYVAPGEVFGELAGFGDFPRESFAEATEAACVWKIPTRTFQALLASRPDLVVAITKQIGDRFKSVENRVESLVFRDVRARVAGILLELARRFGRPRDGGPGRIIDLRLTQAELGTLIGATRQSVNESLGEFSEAGWITRDGRLTVVLDEEALRRAADGTPAGD